MLDELVTAAVSGRGLFLGSARALLRRDEANQPPRAEHAASPSESQRALVPYLLIALTSAVGALWLSYFFLLGSTYVLLSWVLEAASFCHLAPGAHWRVRVDIAAKPHLGALLPYAGIHPALNAPPRAVGAAPRLRPDPRAAWPPPRPLEPHDDGGSRGRCAPSPTALRTRPLTVPAAEAVPTRVPL
jgi:hypothetical protein